ncbi:von Willebrand factor D and EGF domain-containing protein-like [Babylonia areolata]|uniref:von Willebrand factor D and EGF domain-containing protein-like n=1 Tax=Babylonia areolata TaxID=304850 RepID=UPI003FD40A22
MEDPCDTYKELNDDRRSTAYKLAEGEQGLCDMGLSPDWYRFTSGAGGTMPEFCIRRQQCGTVMPVWMNGSHPTEDQGIVSRQVCSNAHGSSSSSSSQNGPTCCEHSTTIGVKNCGHFFVYYLYPTILCSSSYCAGDKEKCGRGQYSATGYSPCVNVYPEDFGESLPSLSEPEVHGRGFRFHCDVNYTGSHQDPDVTYEVQWMFDGHADPNVPNMVLSAPHQRAYLPGTSLRRHLGTNVGCRVRAYYRNRIAEHRSPWQYSNTYWAGIRLTPKVEVSEKGENRTVTVTSTIPILCDFSQNSSCCLHMAVDINGPKDNTVMPHPCHYSLCKGDWNPNTHTATTNITIVATKDQIRDGTQNLLLAFEQLKTGGGGPYLDVFNGYRVEPSQVTVKDADTHICSWVTDPHFNTFDQQHYDLYIDGDFTIYENTQDSFEVQARTYHCNPTVTCNCAIAIREHSDVIRISICNNVHAAPKVEVARKPLREGTVIQQSTDGDHVMVYLPSGREVKVDRVYGDCLNAYLTLPGSDTDHGRGLCGTPDGRRQNDLTHRNGSEDHSCHDDFCGEPNAFIESWRNFGSTSLFDSVPQDLDKHKEDPRYCQCDDHVHGSPRVNCTTAAAVTHRAQQCGSSYCPDVTQNVPAFLQQGGRWTRRDVEYVDRDEPDPPIYFPAAPAPPVTSNVTWPTPSGITKEQAEMKCQEKIQGSQLFNHCAHHTDNLAFVVSSCVTDVLYGDGYDMVDASASAFTAHCQFEVRQDPRNYDVSPDGTLVIKAQFADVCSANCLRHGRCVKGTCVCEPGFTGDNCQLVAGQKPVLERVRGSPFCDLTQRPCRTIYFDASHFQMGDSFNCKVRTVLPDGSLSPTAAEYKAQYISGDRLACPLPVAIDQSVTVFSVSVTYDGTLYSDDKFVTVYDSTCRACNDSGCVQKSGTCLIDNLCHRNGDYKTDDETKMCNTSASTVQWTTAIRGRFPQMSTPVVTGPNRDFMLTCSIPSTERSPSARYRVTWYANSSTVIGQEVVNGAQPAAEISVYVLPSGTSDLQCKVSSYYAESDVFSPEMSSVIFPWQSA